MADSTQTVWRLSQPVSRYFGFRTVVALTITYAIAVYLHQLVVLTSDEIATFLDHCPEFASWRTDLTSPQGIV